MKRSDPAALANLAMRGTLHAGGGNAPIQLEDPKWAWWVESGSVDVFVAECRDGEVRSAYRHVMRAGKDRLLFGFGEVASEASGLVVAKVLPGARVWRLPLASLLDKGLTSDFAYQADAWILDFSKAVSREIEGRVLADQTLQAGARAQVEEGRSLGGSHGIAWLFGDDLGLFLDVEDCDGYRAVPVTPDSWVRTLTATDVHALSTVELAEQGALADHLLEFNQMVLRSDRMIQQMVIADAASMQVARANRRQQAEKQARARLFGLLAPAAAPARDERSALLTALRVVGEHEGIAFREPKRPLRAGEDAFSLQEVLEASGIRSRWISLDIRERWWIGDSGALIAFLRDDQRPVALVPTWTGRYRLHDTAEGSSRKVTSSVASDIDGKALMFYAPLPNGERLSLSSLREIAVKNVGADAVRFAGVGLASALLSVVPPIALGALISRVIPSSSIWQLIQLVIGMIVLAFGCGALQALQGTALLRIEGRVAARLGAALWDRTLALPNRFFRRFEAGDLASRALAFQSLRDLISGGIANAMTSTLFLFPLIALIFVYNTSLGWLSLGLAVALVAVTIAVGLWQVRPQREYLAQVRRVAGDLFQILGGIGKIRGAAAEGMAYARWASGYGSQKSTELRIESVNAHLVALHAAMPMLAGSILLLMFLRLDPDSVEPGDFLAAFGVFMLFLASVIRLGLSFRTVATIVPGVEQVNVFLDETPEMSTLGEDPGRLRGEILFDGVSFRYSDESPLVVDNVTLRVNPGEFVALVGESGSGKSTLLHLGLGLERPSSGTVYFDGKQLDRLHQREVRRQIGVVAQNAAPQPGTVQDNIIGMDEGLTADDAWRAAKLASIDKEIEAMPMGMMTVIGDSVTTFSGGQLQRIMIAAALARRPRLIFLDEATNWLDNQSQAEVVNHITDLAVTLVVSAHRLSTIAKADRIYVMEKGRVVQEGVPAELLATPGPFQSLARRHMM